MTGDKKTPNPSEMAELIVNAERHQQLQDIVSYVKRLHHVIDPDMYRISIDRLEEWEWCVEGIEFGSNGFKECPGFTVKVSWDDLSFLGTVVEVAGAYSHRRSTGQRVENLTDQGFDDLRRWLARSEDVLFGWKIKDR